MLDLPGEREQARRSNDGHHLPRTAMIAVMSTFAYRTAYDVILSSEMYHAKHNVITLQCP